MRYKLLLVALLAALVALFFAFDGPSYLSLQHIKQQQADLELYRQQHPLMAMSLYAALYIVVTSLSLPGAAVLTLAGGGLFGLLWSTLLVSFASTIGATLAFLSSRYLLRDWVRARFASRLQPIEEGLRQHGILYLLTLRLVPIFPFFVINLAMGLTSMKTRTFFWVSQIGMLAGTLVYVNAGTQLAQINRVADVLSPAVWSSLLLLAIFPWLTQAVVSLLQQRKQLARWRKPKTFDYNLIVLGAGAGGLVTTYIAAASKAKVLLIEQNRMGGDCLNSGCVPSKALIHAARLLAKVRRYPELGISQNSACDFTTVMQRVRQRIQQIEPHDSVERYRKLGAEVMLGRATVLSPWQVAVQHGNEQQIFTTRNIVIASGASPRIPDIPGLQSVAHVTSDSIWQLQALPKRMLVLGGGPIGCELGQALQRLGSQVTLVERGSRLLPNEDRDVAETVAKRLHDEGMTLLFEHRAVRFENDPSGHQLILEHQHAEICVAFDCVLLAVGRAPRTQGFGLESLGIELNANGTIKTNPFQQTAFQNIYAVGDVAGPYQLTHVAAHQAWYAAVNALFGAIKRFKTDYSVIPRAVFCEPEVARVGVNEQEALANGIAYEITHFPLAELDRAIIEGETEGYLKVLTVPGKDRILGVTIVGHQAAELINPFAHAMKNKRGLNSILGTVHLYPSMSEANKYAAGVWKRQHTPALIFRLLASWHAWQRDG